MLNKAILQGRLVADPELKTTGSGIQVTSFTIAVNRSYASKQTGERPTDFIDIVAWRGTADFVSRYFKKGSAIIVAGAIQTRTWEDQNGNKRKAVEVVADEVHFAESRKDGGGGGGGSSASGLEPRIPAFDPKAADDFTPITSDDDLPF